MPLLINEKKTSILIIKVQSCCPFLMPCATINTPLSPLPSPPPFKRLIIITKLFYIANNTEKPFVLFVIKKKNNNHETYIQLHIRIYYFIYKDSSKALIPIVEKYQTVKTFLRLYYLHEL